jgi:hypothetical protein
VFSELPSLTSAGSRPHVKKRGAPFPHRKATYFRRYYGYEEHDFVKGFQNDHAIPIGERRECRYANGLGVLELDGKRYALKTEGRIDFSQHES